MNLRLAFPTLLLLLAGACTTSTTDVQPPTTGPWLVEIEVAEGEVLPFHFDLEELEGGALRIKVRNGEEVIVVDDIDRNGDSLVVRMPLFDSEFKGRTQGAGIVTGNWHNYLKGNDYTIPFTARAGEFPRFTNKRKPAMDVDGTWEVHFSPGTADTYPAIGLFKQEPNGRTTGTFMTETGDYRYLEGVVSGDSLLLSCFDGSHAFLFSAVFQGDNLKGSFRSGKHWQEPWVAVRNPQFALTHPDSLTFLREGYEMIDFSFPDLEGNMVSPNDERFKGKPLLIQIMGSWCPNCVDETKLLNEVYAKHHDKGLEIICVAFERPDDPARAIAGLKHFRNVLDVEYPIVYAGRSGKNEAAEKLPFLNHVMSYPTCIMIDRNGKVRRIRTGIYGPSTGEHYTKYKRSLEGFVEELLAEAN
jgi:thiol-disulfide isomerase/thioredoxin